jgi:hypothetical protein
MTNDWLVRVTEAFWTVSVSPAAALHRPESNRRRGRGHRHGGVSAQLISAVLSPYAADYQIAIKLPATLPNGDLPIKASIGSYQSPDNVFIYVQN